MVICAFVHPCSTRKVPSRHKRWWNAGQCMRGGVILACAMMPYGAPRSMESEGYTMKLAKYVLLALLATLSVEALGACETWDDDWVEDRCVELQTVIRTPLMTCSGP